MRYIGTYLDRDPEANEEDLLNAQRFWIYLGYLLESTGGPDGQPRQTPKPPDHLKPFAVRVDREFEEWKRQEAERKAKQRAERGEV